MKKLLLALALSFAGCDSVTPTEYIYEDTLYTTSIEYDTIAVHDTIVVDHGKNQLNLKIEESGYIMVRGYGNKSYYSGLVPNIEATWSLTCSSWDLVILYHSDDTSEVSFDLDTIADNTIYRVDGEWRAN